jgi:hypothetical protein
MSIFRLTLITTDKLKVCKHTANSDLRVRAVYCYQGSSDGARKQDILYSTDCGQQSIADYKGANLNR